MLNRTKKIRIRPFISNKQSAFLQHIKQKCDMLKQTQNSFYAQQVNLTNFNSKTRSDITLPPHACRYSGINALPFYQSIKITKFAVTVSLKPTQGHESAPYNLTIYNR